jgi:hypothetical protein
LPSRGNLGWQTLYPDRTSIKLAVSAYVAIVLNSIDISRITDRFASWR